MLILTQFKIPRFKLLAIWRRQNSCLSNFSVFRFLIWCKLYIYIIKLKGNPGRKQREEKEKEKKKASGVSSVDGMLLQGVCPARGLHEARQRDVGEGGCHRRGRKDRRLSRTKFTSWFCHSLLCFSQRPISLLTSLAPPKSPLHTLETTTNEHPFVSTTYTWENSLFLSFFDQNVYST